MPDTLTPAEAEQAADAMTADRYGYARDLLVSSLDALCAVYGRDVLDVLHEAQQRQYQEE